MTQYNDTSNVSAQIASLQRQINDLRTQPRLISSSIDRGGTQSSDYDGTGIATPGTTGWMIGTDETTGVGYVHVNGKRVTNTDTDWALITAYGTNWSGYSASGWNGMWYRRLNDVVYITGALTKSIAVVGSETAFTMPVGFRPAKQSGGFTPTGLWPTITTAGVVLVAAGTVPANMTIIYPV